MISNTRKNCMGTVSFDGKFNGMRKAQDFIVYPMKDATTQARIQSNKRSGYISLVSGAVTLYPKQYFNGALDVAGALTAEELLMLKASIMATAHGMAGNNGIVYTDNSGALEVFAA